MPGLVGIISKQPAESCNFQLCSMLTSIQYENFYSSGVYSKPEVSSYVGWMAHKGSFSDCMPLTNQTGDLVVILSGDIFEDQGDGILCIQGKDKKTGRRLISLYEEFGEQFVERLNGLFCGVLLDIKRKKVLLFNDRYGMNRIFFHEDKNGVYFASEAKALLAAVPQLRAFDPKGLGEFLSCGCTLGKRSLFQGVNVLPGGSLWVFENGGIKVRGTYFDPAKWLSQEGLSEKEFSSQLQVLFSGLPYRYASGRLPAGISLTGGLDSRMVMACLNERRGEIPCYTFGSMYRDTLDVKIAREVAIACGQPHHVLVLGEEFLRNFSKYLEKAVYISDGYLGMSGAAELYVNSLARQLAPVRLTGNYGGELLRGHRAFHYEGFGGDLAGQDLQVYIRMARTTFQEFEDTDVITFAIFRQAPHQGFGRLAIERSQVIPRTPFMDNELVRLAYQSPAHMLKNEKLSLAVISQYRPGLMKIPTDRGLVSNGKGIRQKVGELQRRALIKGEYWSSHGMPNWLALISTNGLDRLLRKSFFGRDKFQHFRFWTQRQLSGYVRDVVYQGSRDLKDVFNSRRIETIVEEHISGRGNHLDAIDKILTLTITKKNVFHQTGGTDPQT